MKDRGRILLVDDEAALREEIARGLARYGYDVVACESVAAAEKALEKENCDLALLDITMPLRDGWSALPDLARHWKMPVIVVTANADLATRLRAFKEGATDYVAKPFFLEELVARIRSRLPRADAPRQIAFGDTRIDLERRTASRGEADLGLTQTEFDILAYIAARPDRAVTRAMLSESAMASDGDRFDRTVDSHVSRIRAKLGADAAAIKTVWGIGWRFEPVSQ